MDRFAPPHSPRVTFGTAVALIAILACVVVVGVRRREPMRQGSSSSASQRSQVLSAFAQMPLSFEPNRGQVNSRVKFLSRRSNFTIYLSSDGVTLSIHAAKPGLGGLGSNLNLPQALRKVNEEKSEPSDNVSFRFKGANPAATIKGVGRLQSVTNYLIGNDPAKWHSSIPNYSQVKYESIYPGVDLIFYGNYGRLEYDLDVAPGADPRLIKMEFNDADGITLDRAGQILMHAGNNTVALGQPVAYQEFNGLRRPVAAKYVLNGTSQVAIAVSGYDRKIPLIIDPAILYSTYLGGNMAEGQAVAVDAAGEAFVSGWTCCANDFPKAGAYQGNLRGTDNAFVSKFSADGKSLVYSTYLGGSNIDLSTGIAVDSNGDAYVTGLTDSMDFPTMPAHDTALAGGFDAFVTELNPNGSGLIYSLYVGGSGDDVASGIAVDAKGLAYVAGQTFSVDFPVTASGYQTSNPSGGAVGEGFLARIDPPPSPGSNSKIYYATYFGGPAPNGEALLTGAATGGATGLVYVVGGAGGAVPVTTGQSFGGAFDAVVANFDTTQSGPSSVVSSEFIGGSGFDLGTAITTQAKCTANCPAYLTGYTFSADLNLKGAHSQPGGLEDAFIAEVDSHGGLGYVNYVGGSSFDEASGIGVDSKGDEIIAGVSFRSVELPGPLTEYLQPFTSPAGSLFTSSNGGSSFVPANWSSANAGSISFSGIAIDKSVTPSLIYVGTDQNGLWQSTDGGMTFNQIAFAGSKVSAVAVQTGIGTGPKVVFVNTSAGLFISPNAGLSFVPLPAFPVAGPVNVYFLGSEEPVPGSNNADFFVFAGTDHGFFVSTDDGGSFTAATGLTNGNQRTQVFSGVRDTISGTYFVGTDKGVFQSTDDGSSFTPTNLSANAVLSMAVDTSTTPSTVYAATYGNGVIASTDGFNTNLTLGETAPSSNLNYVAVDDKTSNPATVYVGSGDNLAVGTAWSSSDAGHTYTQLDPATFNQPCCIFPVAVNAGEIFAGNYREADAFVVKTNPQGSFITAGDALGGTNHDRAVGVAIDSSDNAYVAGLTYSSDFPVVTPEQAMLGSGSGVVNAFVTKVGYTSSAKLTITPEIDFGTQTLRTPSQSKTAIVTNKSKTETVALGYIRVSGTQAGDFQIVSGATTLAATKSKVPPCGSSLAPKSKCEIAIVYKPLALGPVQVGLLVPNNGMIDKTTDTSTLACLIVGKSKRLH